LCGVLCWFCTSPRCSSVCSRICWGAAGGHPWPRSRVRGLEGAGPAVWCVVLCWFCTSPRCSSVCSHICWGAAGGHPWPSSRVRGSEGAGPAVWCVVWRCARGAQCGEAGDGQPPRGGLGNMGSSTSPGGCLLMANLSPSMLIVADNLSVCLNHCITACPPLVSISF
jgi:hypothetical protein